ncbi:MAG: hypothetical protein IJT43_04385 [Stomatobaculum sp.]|nr:hypothetical protein [Stomatobaculum sp.]
MTAIFLDVDGVLNCFSTDVFVPGTGIFGVEDEKAEILKQISDLAGGARIILTSTWKFTWEKDGPKDIDSAYLVERLAAHGLTITDKIEDNWAERGAGILKYLEGHPEIDSFLILDDQLFDFKVLKLTKHLIQTSFLEDGGLKEKHLKQAKRILKKQGAFKL